MADNKLAELFVDIKLQNKKLLAALGATEKRTKQTKTRMQRVFDGLNLKTLIAGSFGLFAARRALGAVVKSAAAFETALTTVNTIANKTQAEIGAIGEEARKAAVAVGATPQGFTTAMYQAVSAGVALDRSIGFTVQASKLAVAGFTNTTTAVDLLSTVMNAYGDQVGNVTKVSDQLLDVQNRGKVVIGELSATMGRLIPIAAALGVDFEVINGAMATMTAAGINAFESVTALRSLMVALATPTKEQQKIWEGLKVEFGETALRGNGLVKVLIDLAKATGGSVEKLTELGINQRALNAALSLGSTRADIWTKNIEENRRVMGLTEESFGKMEDTMNRGLARLNANWDNFKISIGNAVASIDKGTGALDKTSRALNVATTALSGLSRQQKAQIEILRILQKVDPLSSYKEKSDALREQFKFSKALFESQENIAKLRKESEAFAPRQPGMPPEVVSDGREVIKGKPRIKRKTQAEVDAKFLIKTEENVAKAKKRTSEEILAAGQREFDFLAQRDRRLVESNQARIGREQELSEELIQISEDMEQKRKDIRQAVIDDIAREQDADLGRRAAGIQTFAARWGSIMSQMVIQSNLSFSSIRQAFSAMLADMVAQLAAKAAAFAIINLLTGGTAAGTAFTLGNLARGIVPGFAGGGFTGNMAANKPAGIVHGQEFVMPKSTVDTVGVQLLTAIKNIGSGTTDNRSFNATIGEGAIGMGRNQLVQTLREAFRSGELDFLGGTA